LGGVAGSESIKESEREPTKRKNLEKTVFFETLMMGGGGGGGVGKGNPKGVGEKNFLTTRRNVSGDSHEFTGKGVGGKSL